MADPGFLSVLLTMLAAAAPGQASGAQAAPRDASQVQQRAEAQPETVEAQLRFLHEDGKAPFSKVFTDAGPLIVKATIAGADTAALIDLSTERALTDTALMQKQGVRLGEVTDAVSWRGKQYDRRRAHSVETVLDGQVAITSDLSAVQLNSAQNPGSLGLVMGRGLFDHVALIVVLMEDTRFYGIAQSGNWVMQTEKGARADFAYENAVITLDINGVPVRLFVDLTTKRELELVPEGWKKVFGPERGGEKTITFGPFTRDVNASLLFTPPPIEGVDGMIGLGFLENLGIALDAAAGSATLIGAPVLPLPEAARSPTVNSTMNTLAITDANVVQWNSAPVTDDQLRELLAQTTALPVEPQLQFLPSAKADYETFARLLKIIKEAGVTKFGFVGNEVVAPAGAQPER